MNLMQLPDEYKRQVLTENQTKDVSKHKKEVDEGLQRKIPGMKIIWKVRDSSWHNIKS